MLQNLKDLVVRLAEEMKSIKRYKLLPSFQFKLSDDYNTTVGPAYGVGASGINLTHQRNFRSTGWPKVGDYLQIMLYLRVTRLDTSHPGDFILEARSSRGRYEVRRVDFRTLQVGYSVDITVPYMNYVDSTNDPLGIYFTFKSDDTTNFGPRIKIESCTARCIRLC